MGMTSHGQGPGDLDGVEEVKVSEVVEMNWICAFGAIVSPIYTQQETRSKKVPGRQELKASSPNWSIDQS